MATESLELPGKRAPLLRWHVDGVLARLTRRQGEDAELRARITPLVQAAATLAAHVKRRVQERGDLGGQAWGGYFRGYPGVTISSQYASLLNLGERWFRSSLEFHRLAGTVPGSFSVTGGMWQGLQVRGLGTDAAMIEFARKSEGRGNLVKVGTKTKKGRAYPIIRSVSTRVDNRLKAFAVWSKAKVQVIAPTDAENVAVAAQVAYDAGRSLTRIFGTSAVTVSGADLGLLAAFGR